jgi:tetratricopeptide (TPR) repeat protein
MFPMIGLVQVGGHAMADRFAYIPFIGLFVMAVWGVADWAGDRQISAAWVAVPATVVLIALGAATHRQIGFWRDSSTMWLRAIEVTQNNFVAHDNLAIYLAQRGRVEEAVVHLRAVLAIRPDDPLATLNLGTYELQHGNLQAAIERYKIVTLPTVDPDLRTTAYSNLGSAYRRLGDYANAKQSYEAALQLSPGRPSQAPVFALVGLGLVAQHEGDFAEAVRQFSKAMAVAPTDVGYLLLARALDQSGRATEAQAARQQAGLLSRNLDAAQKQADALMQGK